MTLTSKEGNVGLLGVKRASRQPTDLLSIEFQVVQLRGRQESPTHLEAFCQGESYRNERTDDRWHPRFSQTRHITFIIHCSGSWQQDTDPVVSTHGVEAVGSTDEDQVIVSGHQHFDEVVTLVLKRHYKTVSKAERFLKKISFLVWYVGI